MGEITGSFSIMLAEAVVSQAKQSSGTNRETSPPVLYQEVIKRGYMKWINAWWNRKREKKSKIEEPNIRLCKECGQVKEVTFTGVKPDHIHLGKITGTSLLKEDKE